MLPVFIYLEKEIPNNLEATLAEIITPLLFLISEERHNIMEQLNNSLSKKVGSTTFLLLGSQFQKVRTGLKTN